MPAELLIDTEAFVALVDRSERAHRDCAAVFERWAGPLSTTEGVLAETLHLVGPLWPPRRACLECFTRGAFPLIPSSRDSLPRVADLMAKCRDLPMDFADATLVALAEESRTDHVYTLDHHGFSTHRLHGRKPFRLVPR